MRLLFWKIRLHLNTFIIEKLFLFINSSIFILSSFSLASITIKNVLGSIFMEPCKTSKSFPSTSIESKKIHLVFMIVLMQIHPSLKQPDLVFPLESNWNGPMIIFLSFINWTTRGTNLKITISFLAWSMVFQPMWALKLPLPGILPVPTPSFLPAAPILFWAPS